MAIVALLLDLANILGGFLLASVLLQRAAGVGAELARAAGALSRYAWLIGVVALATGFFFLIDHALNGPRVLHFELVGMVVGVALLWNRLTGAGRRDLAWGRAEGVALLLAIFGLVAIIVGIQGLLTPDG